MDNITFLPFNNCPALDGYHCQTNSLAKIFHHYNHPLSEDMILGLGAEMGFILIFNTLSACGGVKSDVIFSNYGDRENIA